MMNLTFEIGHIPKTTPHLFADCVELLLYFENYSEISKSDLENFLIQEDDIPEKWGQYEYQREIGRASKHDEIYQSIEDCFTQLEYRIKAFSSFYPFFFKERVFIRYGKDELTNRHYLYTFMLICSRLRSFPKNHAQKFSSLFEKVSAQAMKTLLPEFAKVHIFGANSADRKTYYGTDLRVALKKLSENICEYPIEENIEPESSSSDAGLDIVGYIGFDDPAYGSLAFFGQCAAREYDWPQKNFEAHPHKLRAFFNFTHDPMNLIFIPVCYRQATGEWVKNSPSYGAVLLDRLRICHLLKEKALIPEVLSLFTNI